MFADPGTLSLLNKMAEGHAEPSRDGARVEVSTPDRSQHINTIRQHFDQRSKKSFGYWDRLEYFLERSVFRAGLRVQCPVCAYYNWYDLDDLGYSSTCTRCLKQFNLSQLPSELKKTEWYYRVIGPFSAPDYARGGYAVALTLRCITPRHDSELTWSTGLTLDPPLSCEVDFLAWYRRGRILLDEQDEPLLLVGEAKSYGRNAFSEKAVSSIKKFAERFPGCLMVVSSLRNISEYPSEEIGRLRELALWGRRDTLNGKSINPLIVLTGAELFSQHGIYEEWKKTSGETSEIVKLPSSDPADLHRLAELTQRRYLNLPWPWEYPGYIQGQRHRLVRLLRSRSSRLIGLIRSRTEQ